MTISLFNAERLHYGRNYTITVNEKKFKGILYEDCRITEIAVDPAVDIAGIEDVDVFFRLLAAA